MSNGGFEKEIMPIPQTCKDSQQIVSRYREQDHDDSVLGMALDGMIEIESATFGDAAVDVAVAHVAECSLCQTWLDELYPIRVELREKLAKYCCASMLDAASNPESEARFTFALFRGEDPCWCINDNLVFAKFCPWCGCKLPQRPFE